MTAHDALPLSAILRNTFGGQNGLRAVWELAQQADAHALVTNEPNFVFSVLTCFPYHSAVNSREEAVQARKIACVYTVLDKAERVTCDLTHESNATPRVDGCFVRLAGVPRQEKFAWRGAVRIQKGKSLKFLDYEDAARIAATCYWLVKNFADFAVTMLELAVDETDPAVAKRKVTAAATEFMCELSEDDVDGQERAVKRPRYTNE